MSDLKALFKPAMYRTQLEVAHTLTKAQVPFMVIPLNANGSDFLALLSVQTSRLEKIADVFERPTES